MHAPRPTSAFQRGPHRCEAGPCEAGQCQPQQGWFVPYVSPGSRSGAPDARVTVYVTDLSPQSMFSGFLPFVLDTGAAVTTIPRAILPRAAFRRPRKSSRVYVASGAAGGFIVGLRYRAALSIIASAADSDALVFDPIEVFVPESDCPISYGLLGLDALRQIIMVSDKDHVSLWPASPRAIVTASSGLRGARRPRNSLS